MTAAISVRVERVHDRRGAAGAARAGAWAVWLPWLMAPLFVAAPIGGCAMAERCRPRIMAAVEQPLGDAPPLRVVPAGAVVTVARP